MTEAELIESAHLAYGNFIASSALFWTIIVSYLVAAYMAGSKLTRSQIVIVNGLFLIISVISVLIIFNFFYTAMEYTLRANEINPERVRFVSRNFHLAIPMVYTVVVVACLKFMWDVRHPHVEEK